MEPIKISLPTLLEILRQLPNATEFLKTNNSKIIRVPYVPPTSSAVAVPNAQPQPQIYFIDFVADYNIQHSLEWVLRTPLFIEQQEL